MSKELTIEDYEDLHNEVREVIEQITHEDSGRVCHQVVVVSSSLIVRLEQALREAIAAPTAKVRPEPDKPKYVKLTMTVRTTGEPGKIYDKACREMNLQFGEQFCNSSFDLIDDDE